MVSSRTSLRLLDIQFPLTLCCPPPPPHLSSSPRPDALADTPFPRFQGLLSENRLIQEAVHSLFFFCQLLIFLAGLCRAIINTHNNNNDYRMQSPPRASALPCSIQIASANISPLIARGNDSRGKSEK